MSRDVRKALMIAKGPVSSGYLPPGHPEREANLARHMEGVHPELLNKDGSPKTLYHGTPTYGSEGAADIISFSGNGPFFVSESPEFASNVAALSGYSPNGGAVYPVHVSAKKVFDPTKKGVVSSLKKEWSPEKYVAGDIYGGHRGEVPPNKFWQAVKEGDWQAIENSGLLNYLRDEDYDGFVTYEGGSKNYGIFNPRQIKSATGNNGQYDPNEPDITKAEGGYIHDPARHIRKALMIAKADGGDVDDDQSQDTSSPAPAYYQSTLSPAQTTPSSILTGALTNVFGDDRNAARWADKIDQLVDVAQPLYNIGQNFGQSAKSFLSGQYGQGAAQAGSGLMGAAMMAAPVPAPLKEEGVLAAEGILPKITPDYSSVLAARPEEPINLFSTARGSTYAHYPDGSTIRDRASGVSSPNSGSAGGLQPKSAKTVFMNENDVMDVGGLHQNPSFPGLLEPVPDQPGYVGIRMKEDYGPRKAGEFAPGTIKPYSTKPDVGAVPVEVFSSGPEGIHFGTPITHVQNYIPAEPAVGGYSNNELLPPEEIARQAASAKFMEGSNAPPVMYHGTNAARMSHFTDFNQNAVLTDEFGNKTIKQFAGTRGNPGANVVGYAAFDPDFAANFAGANNPEELSTLENRQVSVYPVNVRATNIFDIANPEHRQMVGMEKADQSFLSKITPNFMHPWNWRDLEYNSNKIKNAGFDSYYDYENGINKSKTGIGVFDPRQIKSTFARRFDPEHPDIGEKRGGYITKAEGGYIHDPERNIRHALLLSQMMKSGATLPAAVDLARQLKPGRR